MESFIIGFEPLLLHFITASWGVFQGAVGESLRAGIYSGFLQCGVLNGHHQQFAGFLHAHGGGECLCCWCVAVGPDAFGGEGVDKFFSYALPAVGGVDRQFAGVAVGCCQGNQLAVDAHGVMGMAEAGFCQPPEELLRERLDASMAFTSLSMISACSRRSR